MKKLTLITAILMTANLLFAQINKIDTSFYSEALGEVKMVDVYFPPGYDENPELYYPVIYYLHGWNGDQNSMDGMLSTVQALINNGTIDPVIMVGADNSPDPFGGSFFVNSELWGDYEDYMINDLINWIDFSFRSIPEKNGRALLGQSMGAYGAFRYGIVHTDKFKVFAAHAAIVTFNKNIWMDACRQQVILENQPGPPYAYNYSTDGLFTRGTFLVSGAFSPNASTPQTYINPPVVEYLFDENANYIDSIYQKWQPFDLTHQIKQLSSEDSIGIYFGCGVNDNFLLYPANQALNDTLDLLGLPHEFYSHTGDHTMPVGFKQGALIFIDSLLIPPIITPTTCLPEGITFTTQDEIDNFQTNFPGCKEIEGDVIINGEDISNLEGLSVLTAINGNLNINGISSLISLYGLDNLAYIGQDVGILSNNSLSSLTGLDNVSSIGGGLVIWANENLPNMTGLEGLISIGGNLEIHDNNSLYNLVGFDNLASIEGSLGIGFELMGTTYGNPSLISLAGLDNIDAGSISELYISYNTNLSSCEIQSICDYLAAPNGTVSIHDNAPGCNSPDEVQEACDSITSVAEHENDSELVIAPNPVSDFAEISLNLPGDLPVEICLYNITGICVKRWQYLRSQTGKNIFIIDLKEIPEGIYFCRVQIGNEMITKKIIKVK